MSLNEMRNQSFPKPTNGDWEREVEKTLKGKSAESLNRNTYENIFLKPLYFVGERSYVSDFPGQGDFRIGSSATPSLWKIAQRINAQTPMELSDTLKRAFEKGQTAIAFEVQSSLFQKNGELTKELNDLPPGLPWAVNAKDYQAELLDALNELSGNAPVTGFIARDPFVDFQKEGNEILPSFFNKWKTEIERFPELKTILIDTVPHHNKGANAVQELAFAMAKGVYYIQEFQKAGMELENIFKAMIFQFAIGSNFFMEIAKLRAARILWSKIGEAYEVKSTSHRIHISAETSAFNKTVYDRHVNLLRSGNEAFAAALGGVQYLHVRPFDELVGATEFSERLARNTQLILQEEAHVLKTIDPAGGSWYIESLTTELAEHAWDLFLQIEDKGGFYHAHQSGMLDEEIAHVLEKRLQDVSFRRQSIIGTNVYAQAEEKSQIKFQHEIDGKRLSEPFEELRATAAQIEESNGYRPTVGLICLGELKEHKQRMDFVSGFLAAGGIVARRSGKVFSLDDAKKFVANADTKHFCLCGSDVQYDEIGLEILPILKSEFPDVIFYLAGLPASDMKQVWIEAGLADFIHTRSNCHALLSNLLRTMEVHQDEKAHS